MDHKLIVSFDFLQLVFNFFLQVFRTDPHTIGDDRVKGNACVGIAVDQAEIVVVIRRSISSTFCSTCCCIWAIAALLVSIGSMWMTASHPSF